jgi:hypothetical protein
VNFVYEISLFIHVGGFNLRKILRLGADGFTSPPKEVVQRFFVVTKYPSSSTGFKPAKLGSNGKHVSHYTSESDLLFAITN